MSIYVDYPYFIWKGRAWCHMIADTEAELDAFALKIKLKKEWKQDIDKRRIHYDLTRNKRSVAIRNGAIEITCTALVKRLRLKAEGRE